MQLMPSTTNSASSAFVFPLDHAVCASQSRGGEEASLVQSVVRLADHSAALLASSTLQLLNSIRPTIGMDAAGEALQVSDHLGSQQLAHHAKCVALQSA